MTRLAPRLAASAILAAVMSATSCSSVDPTDANRLEGSDLTACANGPTLFGVDVSHWQGKIDWVKVAGAGESFCFIKATESTGFVDPQFATKGLELDNMVT